MTDLQTRFLSDDQKAQACIDAFRPLALLESHTPSADDAELQRLLEQIRPILHRRALTMKMLAPAECIRAYCTLTLEVTETGQYSERRPLAMCGFPGAHFCAGIGSTWSIARKQALKDAHEFAAFERFKKDIAYTPSPREDSASPLSDAARDRSMLEHSDASIVAPSGSDPFEMT